MPDPSIPDNAAPMPATEAPAPTPRLVPAIEPLAMPAWLPALGSASTFLLLASGMVVFTDFGSPVAMLLIALVAGAPAALAVLAVQPILEAQLRRGQGPRYRRGQRIGLVVLKRGGFDHFLVKEALSQRPSGAYCAEGTPLYVEKTIPRHSTVWIWPEGDPEPFTGRDPLGFGAKWLQNFVGGIRSAAALRPFHRTASLPGILRLVAFIAAALAIGGLLYWFLTSNGWL